MDSNDLIVQRVLAYACGQSSTMVVAVGITVGTDVSEGSGWMMHPEKIEAKMIYPLRGKEELK